jgi:hypothetical protein
MVYYTPNLVPGGQMHSMTECFLALEPGPAWDTKLSLAKQAHVSAYTKELCAKTVHREMGEEAEIAVQSASVPLVSRYRQQS